MTFFTETVDVKSHFKNADKVLVFIALTLLSVGFLVFFLKQKRLRVQTIK